MWPSFQTRVSGKWVLAGEHSVLHGATAIALPHPEFTLNLSFQPSSTELSVEPKSSHTMISDLFRAVEDERALDDLPISKPEGTLHLSSTIPMGAGLGSSAALCVALTRWMAEPLSISSQDFFEFARRLEHRFHGRSSGMDIAVILENEAISFNLEKGSLPLGIRTLPRFTFHDTGLRKRTSDAVFQVENFREEKPWLALQTDEAMSSAARFGIEGLERYHLGDADAGLRLIANAMSQAQECFYTWGLIPREIKNLEEDLRAQGALGVKITGAGGGGFLVALWK